MRKSVAAVLGAALVVVVSVGCHDQSSPMAPESRAAALAIPPRGALLDKHDAAKQPVYPLHRITPIHTSWSFVATPDGAIAKNAAVGLTIIVPAGAVKSNTTITVSTAGSDLVAYRCEPRGIRFGAPLLFVQDMNGIATGHGPITGAYFPGDSPQIDSRSHRLSVDEVEPTVVDERTHRATMLVSHFSGYIFASGRSSTQDE